MRIRTDKENELNNWKHKCEIDWSLSTLFRRRNLSSYFSKRTIYIYKIKYSLIDQHKVTILSYIKLCPCWEVFLFKDHTYIHRRDITFNRSCRQYEGFICNCSHLIIVFKYTASLFFMLLDYKTNYRENRVIVNNKGSGNVWLLNLSYWTNKTQQQEGFSHEQKALPEM
jgi:hypothetical protein